MKKDRLLNPEIISHIAALGHTEYLCIADCGLPIPRGVSVVDVSVKAGIPSFMDVLKTIESELVIESVIVAEEIESANPKVLASIIETVKSLPMKKVPHEAFKKMLSETKCVIRTGETSSYANIILVGGVNF